MSAKLSKIAPIAVVSGILGYLCWPYFDDPAADKKSKTSAKTEALASLLSPAPAGDVRADIFEIPQAIGPSAAKKMPTAGNKTSAANRATTANRRIDDFKNFALTGTYVAGDNRYAVINGTLYAEGEQVTATGRGAKSAPSMYKVARVEIDKVVLSCEGQTKELHYADTSLTPTGAMAKQATTAVDTPKPMERSSERH